MQFPGVTKSIDLFLKKYENYKQILITESLVIIKKEKTSENYEITNMMVFRAAIHGFFSSII